MTPARTLARKKAYDERTGTSSVVVRVLCVDIPRRTLQAVLASPEAAVGRLMRGDSGVSRMLAVLLRETGGELEPAAPVRFPAEFAQALLATNEVIFWP